jgi:hypothetical protein
MTQAINSEQPPPALRWNRLACDAIYYSKTPPTLAGRALAMVHTAMYDAWTSYTQGGFVSTTTAGRLKRPEAEHTRPNREIAFSFAAYRVLMALFAEGLPEQQQQRFADLLKEVGCKINDQTLDVTKPQGIGNLSAKLVLESRRGDGSNQDGSTATTPATRRSTRPRPKNRWPKWEDGSPNSMKGMTRKNSRPRTGVW